MMDSINGKIPIFLLVKHKKDAILVSHVNDWIYISGCGTNGVLLPQRGYSIIFWYQDCSKQRYGTKNFYGHGFVLSVAHSLVCMVHGGCICKAAFVVSYHRCCSTISYFF